jgi:hypothetical protein
MIGLKGGLSHVRSSPQDLIAMGLWSSATQRSRCLLPPQAKAIAGAPARTQADPQAAADGEEVGLCGPSSPVL